PLGAAMAACADLSATTTDITPRSAHIMAITATVTCPPDLQTAMAETQGPSVTAPCLHTLAKSADRPTAYRPTRMPRPPPRTIHRPSSPDITQCRLTLIQYLARPAFLRTTPAQWATLPRTAAFAKRSSRKLSQEE